MSSLRFVILVALCLVVAGVWVGRSNMPPALSALITAGCVVIAGKFGDDYLDQLKRAREAGLIAAKEARDKAKDAREAEAEDLSAAKYWKDDAMTFRAELQSFRAQMEEERKQFAAAISALKAQNERQQKEILDLKGQLFDLQEDRRVRATESGT